MKSLSWRRVMPAIGQFEARFAVTGTGDSVSDR